jgi:hypothetical protein
VRNNRPTGEQRIARRVVPKDNVRQNGTQWRRDGRRSFVENTSCTIWYEKTWACKHHNNMSLRYRGSPFGRPFRAFSSSIEFPGLKAWAVLCSLFGRLERIQENVQTPRGNFAFSEPRTPKYFASRGFRGLARVGGRLGKATLPAPLNRYRCKQHPFNGQKANVSDAG